MPTDIVFPPTSAPGVRPQESGGRLINAFGEQAPVGAPSKIIHRRSPGLQRVPITPAVVDCAHTRGFLDAGGTLLWVLDGKIKVVNSGFGVTAGSDLPGTAPVTFGRNNVGQNVVVTETNTFVVDGAGATSAPDADLPGTPTSVCDFDGFFFWSFGSGQIWASNLNSTVVQASAFTTEQGLFIRRVVRFAGRLYAFGDKWTGVYKDVGTPLFPLAREVTIPRGIVGTHAVAGWETGWANNLLWVGDDFVVYKLDGYTPTPISTDDVSRSIQLAVLAGNRNLIEAYVYMFERNAFWIVTCRDSWTWEYNFSTGEWNERMSYNRASWKGSRSVRIFDQWLIGDQYTSELYRLSGEYFLEGVDPLIWQVESGVIQGFPQGVVVPRASFHITSGVGSYATVVDPSVEISWSLDGGHSYGMPVVRHLGGPGYTKSHPYVLNCGLSRGQGVRYRLRISDPVHVGLMGGVVEIDPRSFAG